MSQHKRRSNSEPEMLQKDVILNGVEYCLAVVRGPLTGERWVSFVLSKGEVINMHVPVVDYREEAMKDAHAYAWFKERLPESYPDDYCSGWRKVELGTNHNLFVQ